jgi:acetyl-CoA carboxylase biotin carboxyl carrier protein
MDTDEQHEAWIERVEDLIHMLQGSSVSELELSEAGMEITIRRQPDMVLVTAPTPQQHLNTGHSGTGSCSES